MSAHQSSFEARRKRTEEGDDSMKMEDYLAQFIDPLLMVLMRKSCF